MSEAITVTVTPKLRGLLMGLLDQCPTKGLADQRRVSKLWDLFKLDEDPPADAVSYEVALTHEQAKRILQANEEVVLRGGAAKQAIALAEQLSKEAA